MNDQIDQTRNNSVLARERSLVDYEYVGYKGDKCGGDAVTILFARQ
jgi:hypothetical protein